MTITNAMHILTKQTNQFNQEIRKIYLYACPTVSGKHLWAL